MFLLSSEWSCEKQLAEPSLMWNEMVSYGCTCSCGPVSVWRRKQPPNDLVIDPMYDLIVLMLERSLGESHSLLCVFMFLEKHVMVNRSWGGGGVLQAVLDCQCDECIHMYMTSCIIKLRNVHNTYTNTHTHECEGNTVYSLCSFWLFKIENVLSIFLLHN